MLFTVIDVLFALIYFSKAFLDFLTLFFGRSLTKSFIVSKAFSVDARTDFSYFLSKFFFFAHTLFFFANTFFFFFLFLLYRKIKFHDVNTCADIIAVQTKTNVFSLFLIHIEFFTNSVNCLVQAVISDGFFFAVKIGVKRIYKSFTIGLLHSFTFRD